MKPHLVLFFTRGVSLRTWSMVGMLDREVALYNYLGKKGFQVSFVTYGDSSDLSYSGRLGDIRILCNESNLPPGLYENLLFAVHGQSLGIVPSERGDIGPQAMACLEVEDLPANVGRHLQEPAAFVAIGLDQPPGLGERVEDQAAPRVQQVMDRREHRQARG